MTAENGKASDEAQIRTLIDARAKAVRAKDLAGAMANVAHNSAPFDPGTGRASLDLQP